MSHFLEGPIVDHEPESELRRLADQVADFIHPDEWQTPEDGPDPGAMIIGVFGARGSGKTSLLYTLFDVLAGRNSSANAGTPPRRLFALPNASAWRDRLLELEHSREDDDLLFALVEFLVERYTPSSAAGNASIGELLGPEVRRRQLPRFLDYVRETTPRLDELPTRLGEEFAEQAKATATIRGKIAELIRWRQDGGTLVLLVDDLDLQPRRALHILILLRVFFDLPRVAIIVAADRDLLLRRLRDHLEGATAHLAGALLGKLIPYQFALPIPPPDQRFAEVWGSQSANSGAVVYWPTTSDQRWLEARLLQFTQAADEDEAPPVQSEESALPGTSREAAETYLSPLLPTTWRGLKALRLRLDGAARQYDAAKPFAVARRFDAQSQLGLDSFAVAPFLSLVLAVDVAWPELQLFDTLLHTPGEVARVLRLIQPRADLDTNHRGTDGPSKIDHAEPWPMVAEGLREIAAGLRPSPALWEQHEPVLHSLSGLEGRDRAAATAALRRLALSWDLLQSVGRGSAEPPRFLAVTLDDDALETARAAWDGLIPEEDRVHLRIEKRVPRTEPANLMKQKDELAGMLREKLPDGAGRPLWLHALMPLSLGLWLGWQTRYWKVDRVYNVDRNTGLLTPFPTPRPAVERLVYEVRTEFFEHSPAATGPGEGKEAVVLIDPLRRSTPDQLALFEAGDQLIAARHHHRLLGPTGLRLAPEHTAAAIDDVVQLLRYLREHDGVDRFHLAYAGPLVLAILIGRQLNQFHPRIYDWSQEERKYRYVLTLED